MEERTIQKPSMSYRVGNAPANNIAADSNKLPKGMPLDIGWLYKPSLFVITNITFLQHSHKCTNCVHC